MLLTYCLRPLGLYTVMKCLALGEVAHAAHAQFLGTTEVEGREVRGHRGNNHEMGFHQFSRKLELGAQ